MQPSWLLTSRQQRVDRIGVMLTAAFITVLATWLADCFGDLVPRGDLSVRLDTQLNAVTPIFGNSELILSSIGLVTGLIVGLKRTIQPIETLKWSWARAWSGMRVGLRRWSIAGLKYGIYTGLIIGLIGGAISALFLDTGFKSAELAVWSRLGLIAGAITGLIAGVTVWLIAKPHTWLNIEFHQLKLRLKRALVCGLIAGLSVGFSLTLSSGLAEGLVLGATTALSIGSIVGLSRGLSDRLVFRLANALIVGLIAGLIVGLGNGVVTWLVGVLLLKGLHKGLFGIWLFDGLSVGATVGLLVGLIARVKEKAKPIGTLQQSREVRNWQLQSAYKGAIVGIAAALISGLILSLLLCAWHNLLAVQVIAILANRLGMGLLSVLNISSLVVLICAIAGALTGGELGALIGVLSKGLTGPNIELRTTSNQGIWRSAKYAAVFALIGGLTLGLIWGLTSLLASMLITGFAPRLEDWLHYWLVDGLFLGILSSLIPGAACIQHFILRLILWQNRSIPWNYTHFLDYATERIFLQKVGGGYIFIHRLLLEHFAHQ